MKNLFEYSDILRSPIEAFSCSSETFSMPVVSGTILLKYFICRKARSL